MKRHLDIDVPRLRLAYYALPSFLGYSHDDRQATFPLFYPPNRPSRFDYADMVLIWSGANVIIFIMRSRVRKQSDARPLAMVSAWGS